MATNVNGRKFKPEDFNIGKDSYSSRSVSWTTHNNGFSFDYYAVYVAVLDRWFFSGREDFYKAEGGVTTSRLCDVLNEPDTWAVWLSSEWCRISEEV